MYCFIFHRMNFNDKTAPLCFVFQFPVFGLLAAMAQPKGKFEKLT